MSKNLDNARQLRKNQTPQEKKLWNILRNRNFFNLKFRRQVPIDKYIVDFLCEERKIIIELDGGQHNFEEHQEYDKIRTEFLENMGYKVLRFWNFDIDENIEGVLEQIMIVLDLK